MPSPIQIKRPDVVEDARSLAALMGVPITDAIGTAVKAQLALQRVNAEEQLAKRRIAAERALEELRQLPVVGPKMTDRDFYDAEGLPK